MNIKNILWIVFVIILVIGIYFGIRSCYRLILNPGIQNPVVSVTPIVDPGEIDNLNLPDLPNNETPAVIIPVATPVPVPGTTITPHVVVSDEGNTYIAYTVKMDFGFKLEPKLVCGYSDSVFFGVGATVFKVWRFETDILLFYELDEDLRLGIGESYQLTNNTSIGVTFSENTNLQPSVGLYLSLKF